MSNNNQFSLNDILFAIKIILIIIMLVIVVDQFIYLSVESNCNGPVIVSGKNVSCSTNGPSKSLLFPTPYEFMSMAIALIILLMTDFFTKTNKKNSD